MAVLHSNQNVRDPEMFRVLDAVSTSVGHFDSKGCEWPLMPELLERFQIHGFNMIEDGIIANRIVHLAFTRNPNFSGALANEMIPFSAVQPT